MDWIPIVFAALFVIMSILFFAAGLRAQKISAGSERWSDRRFAFMISATSLAFAIGFVILAYAFR